VSIPEEHSIATELEILSESDEVQCQDRGEPIIAKSINFLRDSTKFWLDTHERVRLSGKFNYEGCRIPVRTALNIPRWRHWVGRSGVRDRKLCEFLEFGWPLGVNKAVLQGNHRSRDNHKGALEFESATDCYINNECHLGALIGPFDVNPLSSELFTSPINSIPKAGSTDRRFITDLSFPKGCAINDGIDKDWYLGEFCKLSYPTVDDFVSIVKKKGVGSYMFKRDLSRAYRQFALDPGDINLQGIFWKDRFFIDCALVMGCRSAAMMCQRATSAIVGFMESKDINICAYLDDFAGCSKEEVAMSDFLELGSMVAELGLKESVKKAHPPSTRMEFLGIMFDSVTMTMEVTPSRLLEIKDLLSDWLVKRSASKTEIQMLIGKLQFAAKCVPAGRLFISRMIDVLSGLKKQTHRFRITSEFRKDVQWWNRFLLDFNGVSLMLEDDWSSPDGVISTDACLTGGGGWIDGSYFRAEFPKAVLDLDLHINALELLTLMVSLRLWCPRLVGRKIRIYCDNEATVCVINSGRCKDKYMLRILREIVYLCSVNHCWIRAVHIAGVENRLADKLSRSHKFNPEKLKELNSELSNWSECNVFEDSFDCRDKW